MRQVDELHLEQPFLGSRRLKDALEDRGLVVNRKHVQRLMRIMSITALPARRHTSRPHPAHPVYPYLLRSLTIDRPNQVWCTDITYGTPSHQRSPPGRELRCLSMTGMQIHGVNVEPDLLLLREEVSRSGGDGSDTDPVTKSADNGVCGEVVTPR